MNQIPSFAEQLFMAHASIKKTPVILCGTNGRKKIAMLNRLVKFAKQHKVFGFDEVRRFTMQSHETCANYMREIAAAGIVSVDYKNGGKKTFTYTGE